eukprot:scaffold5506_cov42-Prasinocladus_malaysianus.AAC.3
MAVSDSSLLRITHCSPDNIQEPAIPWMMREVFRLANGFRFKFEQTKLDSTAAPQSSLCLETNCLKDRAGLIQAASRGQRSGCPSPTKDA